MSKWHFSELRLLETLIQQHVTTGGVGLWRGSSVQQLPRSLHSPVSFSRPHTSAHRAAKTQRLSVPYKGRFLFQALLFYAHFTTYECSQKLGSVHIVLKNDRVQLHRASTVPANRACFQVRATENIRSYLCRFRGGLQPNLTIFTTPRPHPGM